MSPESVPSPVPGWVAANGELPHITPEGLKGVDPGNGLAFVNLNQVAVKLRPVFKNIFITQDGASVVYFFGTVTKLSTSLIPQKRVLIIGSHTIYLLYTDGKISRCIPIRNITSIASSPDKHLGLSVENEHGLIFKVETDPEQKRIDHVVSVLHAGDVKKEKYATKDVMKGRIKLIKNPGWVNTTQKLVAVSLKQLETARTPTPATLPAPPPCSSPRSAVTPVAESDGAASLLLSEPCPASPSPKQEAPSKREKLAAQRKKLSANEMDLTKQAEDLTERLQTAVASDIANSLDRKRLCESLNLDLPYDCQNPPSYPVPKEPLHEKVKQKVEQLNSAKASWRSAISALEVEALSARKQIADINIPVLEEELETLTSVGSSTWDTHLSMAAEIQELVLRIDSLANTTEEIGTQITLAARSHADKIDRLEVNRDDAVCGWKVRIADLQRRYSALNEGPDQHTVKEELLREKIAAATAKRGALRASVAALRAQVGADQQHGKIETISDSGAAQQLPTDEELAEEMRDASFQLQSALHRIDHLQDLASDAPTIAHRLELKEAEKQKLEFEAREMLIKGKTMKQEFESKLTDLKVRTETTELKIGKLESGVAEHDEAGKRELEAARKKFIREAAMLRKETEIERAKVENAKKEAQRGLSEVENYYVTEIRAPAGQTSRNDLAEIEEQLRWTDNAIETVQQELGQLSTRDMAVREKFERSEDKMRKEERVLLNKITLWDPVTDAALVDKAKQDLSRLSAQKRSLEQSMDTFAIQARSARDRHNKREMDLMSERHTLLRSISEAQQSQFSMVSNTSPLGPKAPSWMLNITATREPGEKWGLSCDGVMVATVVHGSPVDRAGLEVGQQIITVNNIQVHTKEQVYAAFTSECTVHLAVHD
eukprot:TRINITY_DN6857_c0_g1_i1.p1 TRINITY_DN6857_c0_g1~~TRINITY_DN6857_c0_g1_i1.p1  ORF type:complete len:910 (+),score=178.36 TRINITY_DN6857_c0_g1_i1:63-2732(+)